MKIAIVDSLPSGGAKRSTHAIVRRLAEHHELGLFSLLPDRGGFSDFEEIVSDVQRFPFAWTPRFRFPWSRAYSLWQLRDLSRLEAIQQEVARAVDAGGYDLCYLPSCGFTELPLTPLSLKTPSVYHAASLDSNVHARDQRDYNRPRHPVLQKVLPDVGYRRYLKRRAELQERALHNTTRCLAISRFMREQLYLRYGVNARVVSRAVDSEVFYPDPDRKPESLVLSVGSMEPRKGHDFVVEAASRIPRRLRPRVGVVHNTDHEPERRYLEILAREKQVDVEFIQFVKSPEDMRRLYNRAALVCCASRMEALGRVPLEAGACGVPVVAVAEAGLRETVRHEQTGFLVERDETDAAACMERLLSHPEEAAAMGRQAREYIVAEWNWEGVLESLAREFARVLGRDETLQPHAPEEAVIS